LGYRFCDKFYFVVFSLLVGRVRGRAADTRRRNSYKNIFSLSMALRVSRAVDQMPAVAAALYDGPPVALSPVGRVLPEAEKCH
jgi:hypothetical protein